MPTQSQRRNIFQINPQKYLFIDEFRGQNIDLSKWTVVDSEGKISENNGLVFSGGKATPAWGDPGVISTSSWTRQNGLIFIGQITPNATNTNAKQGLCVVNDGSGAILFQAANNGFFYYISQDGENLAILTPYAYLAGVSYLGMIIIQSTGALWYISNDEGITWRIVGVTSVGSTSTIFIVMQSLTAALTAASCKVYHSSPPYPIINIAQSITPSLGSDIATNGGFDSNTVGWGATRSTIASIAGGQSGNCLEITLVSGTTQDATQQPIWVIGAWYQYGGYLKSGTSGDETGKIQIVDNAESQILSAASGVSSGSWTQYLRCWRATETNHKLWVRKNSPTAGTMLFDGVFTKPLTLSSLVGPLQVARKEGIWERALTGIVAGQVGGFYLNWNGATDATQCCVEVLVDRAAGTLRVSKYVNGTLSNNLLSSAVSYVDGQVLRAVRVGNSVAVYYNSVLIGSTLVISDADIISQVGAACFQTDAAISGNLVVYSGIGVP